MALLSKYSQMALLEGLNDWVSMRELAGFASEGGARELGDQLGIALLVLRASSSLPSH
jgi:hypothetical protein